MIDLHSHIISNVDDGAKDIEMSVNMLKLAEECGTTKIVATPHFFRGYFEVPSEKIREKLNELRKIALENNISIEIIQGQEVYYHENILEYYNEGLISTINDSRYMLIEFPMKDFSIREIKDNLYELQIKGIVPVIAHPERYHRFIKEPRLINKFIEEGYLFQLNSGSIAGDFGRDVKKTAEIFIKNKIYNFMGSDGHRIDKRTTDIKSGIIALEKLDQKYLEFIRKSSNDLLLNNEVEFLGEKIKEKKKGIFSIFIK